jgi:hypothetical protein
MIRAKPLFCWQAEVDDRRCGIGVRSVWARTPFSPSFCSRENGAFDHTFVSGIKHSL